MNSFSTKQRIFGTIGLTVIVLVIVGFVGYRSAHRLNEAMAYNYDNYFIASTWISEAVLK